MRKATDNHFASIPEAMTALPRSDVEFGLDSFHFMRKGGSRPYEVRPTVVLHPHGYGSFIEVCELRRCAKAQNRKTFDERCQNHPFLDLVEEFEFGCASYSNPKDLPNIVETLGLQILQDPSLQRPADSLLLPKTVYHLPGALMVAIRLQDDMVQWLRGWGAKAPQESIFGKLIAQEHRYPHVVNHGCLEGRDAYDSESHDDPPRFKFFKKAFKP